MCRNAENSPAPVRPALGTMPKAWFMGRLASLSKAGDALGGSGVNWPAAATVINGAADPAEAPAMASDRTCWSCPVSNG